MTTEPRFLFFLQDTQESHLQKHHCQVSIWHRTKEGGSEAPSFKLLQEVLPALFLQTRINSYHVVQLLAQFLANSLQHGADEHSLTMQTVNFQ